MGASSLPGRLPSFAHPDRPMRQPRFPDKLPTSVAGDAAGFNRGLMLNPKRSTRLP
jgi:hypothetical protein